MILIIPTIFFTCSILFILKLSIIPYFQQIILRDIGDVLHQVHKEHDIYDASCISSCKVSKWKDYIHIYIWDLESDWIDLVLIRF